MTTGIPIVDFYIAGFITATLLACTFAARQWIVRHLGRARPLPDLPQGDEASAPESMIAPVVVAACQDHYGGWWKRTDNGWVGVPQPAPMQGSHAPDPFPMHFYGDK